MRAEVEIGFFSVFFNFFFFNFYFISIKYYFLCVRHVCCEFDFVVVFKKTEIIVHFPSTVCCTFSSPHGIIFTLCDFFVLSTHFSMKLSRKLYWCAGEKKREMKNQKILSACSIICNILFYLMERKIS